jgi:hypothetical protein
VQDARLEFADWAIDLFKQIEHAIL